MSVSLGNAATDATDRLRARARESRTPAGAHPRASRRATAGSHSSIEERCRVVEVRPPRKTKQDRRGLQRCVEPEFFPLVSAAHEFKTPLVAMLGYTDLMKNGQLGPVTEKQREVLGEIQESAERLQELIEDLLLLCQLKTAKGGSESRTECAEANLHIHEIFNYWAPLAARKPITYEFLPAPGDPWVGVEALKLQHIVSNLIGNAIKFTCAGGRVVVSVHSCFWDRRQAETGFLFNLERHGNQKIENAVRIDVCDTGPGIHRDHHEEIFRDFVQLPGASSRGTGLGLAIARRLTEIHGGAIWVESEPGRGSKFSLVLNSAGYRKETKGNARQHPAR
jgi:signal transduction histidine kinase